MKAGELLGKIKDLDPEMEVILVIVDTGYPLASVQEKRMAPFDEGLEWMHCPEGHPPGQQVITLNV